MRDVFSGKEEDVKLCELHVNYRPHAVHIICSFAPLRSSDDDAVALKNSLKDVTPLDGLDYN